MKQFSIERQENVIQLVSCFYVLWLVYKTTNQMTSLNQSPFGYSRLFPAPLPRKRKLDNNFNLIILIFQYKQKQEKKTHASVTRLYWLKVFMSIFHSSINQEHISPFPWLYWSEVVAHLSITVTSGRLEPIEHYKLKWLKMWISVR